MGHLAVRSALLAAVVSAGCAPVTAGSFINTGSQEFFGRHVVPGAGSTATAASRQQGGEAVTAQASAIAQLGRDQITVQLTNHGRRPIRLSYVLDEFSALTANGRAVALEKDARDFLRYPDQLEPSSEATLGLWLPPDVPLGDVRQLQVTLGDGRIPVILRPIGPRPSAGSVGEGPRQWPTPPSAPLITSAWPPVATEAPAAVEAVPVPMVPEPTGGAAPVLAEPPVGTTPVTVEFEQELGTALKANVRWDQNEAVTTLAPGEHRMFYVVPGQHELHLVSRMPSIAQTSGSVPVAVSPEAPIRIVLTGQAKLTGPLIQVRIWKGQDLLFDHRFTPASGG